MPSVYIVQVAPKLNYVPAEAYGELIPIFKPGEQVTSLTVDSALDTAESVLHNYDADIDYLLLTGDPAAIAVATAVIARRHGRIRLLKWDREACRYHVVEVTAC